MTNKPTIIPPKSGWKESTWYLVDVSYNKNNPVHRSLFYSGFLNDTEVKYPYKDTGMPGAYSCLVPINGLPEEHNSWRDIYYMMVICELFTEEQLELKAFVMPDEIIPLLENLDKDLEKFNE